MFMELVRKLGVLIPLWSLTSTVEAGFSFPGVFPLLTTGWYYKPGPTESIVLGLLVVKLLALRLGATVAGVPYHLNDIFDSNALPFFKRGKRNLLLPNYNGERSTVPLTQDELEALERILLALRRIDSHDCFIRYICQANQNQLNGEKTSASDNIWLNVFKLKPTKSSKMVGEASVWDIYADALTSERTNCTKKYKECPLTESDLTKQGLMSGLF